MKQFIKSLRKDGECFRYVCSQFPKLSEAKLKEFFTGPDIQKRLSNRHISETMQYKEKEIAYKGCTWFFWTTHFQCIKTL